MIKQNKYKDSAVSPVVGVLLMLVVTIIIAAVISGFAGGLVETKEKTPQVALDVTFYGGDLVIRHLSGDPINTRQTELITSWTNRTTGEINYAKTIAIPEKDPGVYDTSQANTDLGTPYHEPYFIVPGIAPETDESLWWGNYLMKVGDVVKVDGNLNTTNAVKTLPVIKNVVDINRNDIINVKLIDSVTGGMIYEKNINPVV